MFGPRELETLDSVWMDCRLATMEGERGYGIIEDGAVAIREHQIVAVGPAAGIRAAWTAEQSTDLGRHALLPGLINAHGHAAMTLLREYQYPGNVRELENRIKRAVIMAEGNRITAADLELAGAFRQAVPDPALQHRIVVCPRPWGEVECVPVHLAFGHITIGVILVVVGNRR